jgi:hypothetical protein
MEGSVLSLSGGAGADGSVPEAGDAVAELAGNLG